MQRAPTCLFHIMEKPKITIDPTNVLFDSMNFSLWLTLRGVIFRYGINSCSHFLNCNQSQCHLTVSLGHPEKLRHLDPVNLLLDRGETQQMHEGQQREPKSYFLVLRLDLGHHRCLFTWKMIEWINRRERRSSDFLTHANQNLLAAPCDDPLGAMWRAAPEDGGRGAGWGSQTAVVRHFFKVFQLSEPSRGLQTCYRNLSAGLPQCRRTRPRGLRGTAGFSITTSQGLQQRLPHNAVMLRWCPSTQS